MLLASGRAFEVFAGTTDHTSRKGGGDFHLSTFQELEEPFGVFPLLVCRFLENVGDLDKPFLSGLAGEIGVAVSSLRFTGERSQQVLLRHGSWQIGHLAFLSIQYLYALCQLTAITQSQSGLPQPVQIAESTHRDFLGFDREEGFRRAGRR